MKRFNRKTTKIIAAILVLVLMASVVSLAMFTDREYAKMQFTTATFSADGYTLKREAPVGPFIAGENVSVTLWETNTKDEDVNSVITMNVGWNSPDPNSKIFGNATASDNAIITISGDGLTDSVVIDYTVNNDGTITFDLPKHLLTQQSSESERQLTFQIPASLVATGSLSFTFQNVALSQVPSGFSAQFSAADLNADTNLNFSVDVGWAASANTSNNGKNLMAYLTSDGKGIEFEHAFGSSTSAMKDFSSATDALWSNYNDTTTKITFIEGMTTIGDYAFAEFTDVSSVSFPSTITGIGKSSFDGSGLTGEVTIPKNVTTIEERAFGNLPNATVFTFGHGENDVLTLPNNEASGKTSAGAFHVGTPYSQTAPLGTMVNTNNKYVLDYDWSIDARGYTVTVKTVTGVTVTAAPTTAINGQSIGLTSESAAGYEYTGSVVSWVENSSSETLTLSKDDLTFTMPVGNVTVTPAASLITYYIKYETNGGSFADDVPTEFTVVTDSFDLPTPSRTGYQFDGWYEESDFSGDEVTELPKGSIGDKTFYAKWVPITYQVKYNANTGSGTMSNSTHTYDTAKALTKNAFTKTGYAFDSWNTEADGSGTDYADQASVKNLTDTDGAVVEIYAQWKLLSYSITYHPNDGTLPEDADTDYTVEDPATLPEPTRPGYEFDGWYESEDFSGNPVTDTEGETGDKEYYAKWTPITYSVKYNANGGSGSMSNSSHTYDIAKNLTANAFTKTGYTFAGWATSSTGSVVYADQASVKNLTATNGATVNLYAVWTANTYTVKYNANGGSGSMSNSSHTYDTAKNLTANAFTKAGYTFAGWATSSTGSVVYADQASVKNLTATNGATVNLYAVWTANTYTVKYNANGGSGTMSNSSHTYDTVKTLTANAFTKAGYTFAGWATSSTGSVVYVDQASVKNLTATNGATVNLYAVWTANTYTVKYNANGGSGSMSNSSHTYDIAKNLTANAFTKTGYTFAGWATSSTGSVVYADQASVKNLTSTNGATVNLYAVWTANTNTAYTVKHWTQNLGAATTQNSTNYTLYATENKTGTTDASVTPAVKTITGFTSPSTQTVTISGDGSTVVNYYYTRNSYTFTLGSGTGVTTTGSSATGSYQYGATITLKASANTGYTWSKWISSNSDLVDNITTANTTFTMPAGNITMTPSATANTYTVKYNANGGSGTMSDSSHTYDTAKNLTANAFTKTGYTFAGWATSSTGSVAYADQASVKNLTATNGATVNLYAVWTANTYTVKYNANGGSGTMSNSSHTYDIAKTLTANAFTKSGYEFLGWATSADGDVVYADQASVKNLTATNGATINLYAKWKLSIIPMLAAQDTWFDPASEFTYTYNGSEYNYSKTNIDYITFYDSYTPTGDELITWDASDSSVPGSVTAYVVEDDSGLWELIIAGNGYGLIYANPDSSNAFSSMQYVTSIANLDILDTRNATTMESMFYYCKNLSSIDVSSWNVSNVETMSAMFRYCDSISTIDLSKNSRTAKDGSGSYEAWNTTSLNNTSYMFMDYGGPNYSLTSVDMTDWDTSSLEGTAYMFMDNRNLTEIKGIEDWDVSSLTIANNMFQACESITTIDVSAWRPNKLENAAVMFSSCSALQSIDISDWDMSNVTDSSSMFGSCTSLTELTIPESLTVIGTRFAAYCPNLTTITFEHAADTSITFPTAGTYTGAFLIMNNGESSDSDDYVAYTPINTLDTKVVTSNQNVLNYNWTSDRRGYLVSVASVTGGTVTAEPSVTYNMQTKTIAINGKTVTLTPTASDGYTYNGATVSYTESGTAKTITLNADTLTFTMPAADVTITPKWAEPIAQAIYTASDGALTFIKDTKLYTTSDTYNGKAVTAVYTGFETAGYGSTTTPWYAYRTSIKSVNFVDTITPNATRYWFYEFTNCSSWNLAKLDTTNVTSMNYMFYTAASEVTNVTLDVSNLNTTNVTTMNYMFHQFGRNSSTVTITGLYKFSTANVTQMSSMFAMCGQYASSLSLDISGWDTGNVGYMNSMFFNCGYRATSWKVGDLSNWDTSNVTTMSSMFFESASYATSVTVGDLSGWNTSNVTNMGSMFRNFGRYCSSFYLDLSGWNVTNVTSYTDFNYGVTSKVIAPNFVSTTASLSLTSGVELPDDVTTGEAQTITAMSDVIELNSVASTNAPENTVLYGWLIDSGLAQQIVLLEDFEETLNSVYEIESEYELTITPLYQAVQESELEASENEVVEETSIEETVSETEKSEENASNDINSEVSIDSSESPSEEQQIADTEESIITDIQNNFEAPIDDTDATDSSTSVVTEVEESEEAFESKTTSNPCSDVTE